MLGPFDIVLCRNVAIYFDEATRADLFRRITAEMTTEGYLFVGSSESLNELGPRFTPVLSERAVYYRPNLGMTRTAAHTQAAAASSR